MNKILILIITVVLILGSVTVIQANEINIDVTVNGGYVHWTDAKPFIDKNSRTQVPLRATMEACDLNVDWNDSTREAIVTDGTTTVIIPIGKKYITINGKQKSIDTSAQIKNSRTYLPIRAVAEAFGYGVYWSGNSPFYEPYYDQVVSLVKLPIVRDLYFYDSVYPYPSSWSDEAEIIVKQNGMISIKDSDEWGWETFDPYQVETYQGRLSDWDSYMNVPHCNENMVFTYFDLGDGAVVLQYNTTYDKIYAYLVMTEEWYYFKQNPSLSGTFIFD